jgi:hypothetical protein
MRIIDVVLPQKVTNEFKGNKIALYVFIVIVIMTLVRSCIHIFAPDGGAQSIAGFPLNTYTESARSMVILVFSLWGASQLLMGIVYLVVLIRYKSLITFMYFLILIEYLSRMLLGFFKPAISVHTIPGGVLDYIMIPLALFMLILIIRSNNTGAQRD